MQTPPFPVLYTERLLLREVQDTDRPGLFRLFTRPEVTQYYHVMPLHAEPDAQKIVNMFRKVYMERTGLRWVITAKGGDSIIGIIGFHTIVAGHKGTMVYVLDPAWWGRGLVTEAIAAVIQYGFEQLGLKRIDAEVMPGNTASEKALLKNGFQHEGLLRNWIQWNGEIYDVNMYSRIGTSNGGSF